MRPFHKNGYYCKAQTTMKSVSLTPQKVNTLTPELNYFTLDLVGRAGIPNTVRENLLQDGTTGGEAALLLDNCFYAGLRAGHSFTHQTLMIYLQRAGLNISPALVRRALKHPAFIKNGKDHPKRGRATQFYTLPSVMDLITRYGGGRQGTTDPLDAEDLRKLSTYRAALHREFIRRNSARWGRKKLGWRLGVSKWATLYYEKYFKNFRCKRRVSCKPFFTLNELPERQEFRSWLTVEKPDGTRFKCPAIRSLAARLLKIGYQLTLWIQEVNEYAFSEYFDLVNT